MRSELERAQARIRDLESRVRSTTTSSTEQTPKALQSPSALQTPVPTPPPPFAPEIPSNVCSIIDALMQTLLQRRSGTDPALPSPPKQFKADPSKNVVVLSQLVHEALESESVQKAHLSKLQQQCVEDAAKHAAEKTALKDAYTKRHTEILQAFCQKQQELIRRMHTDYMAEIMRYKKILEQLGKVKGGNGLVDEAAKATTDSHIVPPLQPPKATFSFGQNVNHPANVSRIKTTARDEIGATQSFQSEKDPRLLRYRAKVRAASTLPQTSPPPFAAVSSNGMHEDPTPSKGTFSALRGPSLSQSMPRTTAVVDDSQMLAAPVSSPPDEKSPQDELRRAIARVRAAQARASPQQRNKQ